MASPERFFSTLAQSSAALIGLIIAIATVQYEFERRRVDERTESLREQFEQLKDKYERVFDVLIEGLERRSSDESLIEVFTDNKHESIDATNGFNDLDITYPKTFTVFSLLILIIRPLSQLKRSNNPAKNFLLTESELAQMHTASTHLNQIFTPPEYRLKMPFSSNEDTHTDEEYESFLQELSSELAGVNNVSEFTNLFDEEDYVQYTNVEEENIVVDWLVDYRGFEPDELKYSGRDIGSLKFLFSEFNRDIGSIMSNTGDTLVTYEPKIIPILKLSFWLAVVGVLIPIATLLTIPTEFYITGWPLLILEGLTILGVVVLLWMIVQKLMSNFAP